jgi:tetratricopeptide (TPR) repeat protein
MNRFFVFIIAILMCYCCSLWQNNVFCADDNDHNVFDLIINLCKKGEYNAALISLDNRHNFFTELPERHEEYFFWKARCYLGIYEYDKAKENFFKTINFNDSVVKIHHIYWASRCAIYQGNHIVAIDILTEALKMDHKNKLLLSQRAFAFAGNSQFDQAGLDLKRLNELEGKSTTQNCRIEYNRACVFMMERKFHQAENIFHQCLKIHGENNKDCWDVWGSDCCAEINGCLAKIHYEKELYNNALKCINKSLQIEPKNGQWYLARARIYDAINEPQEALQDLDMVISLSSGLEEKAITRKKAIIKKIIHSKKIIDLVE